MKESYYLKYGYKQNGELVCAKAVLQTKPDRHFYYTEGDECKPVLNPTVVKLTKDVLESLDNSPKKEVDR